MSKSNKFGFDPIAPQESVKRKRRVGPMGAAVREAAESLTEATENKVEQRRQNTEDAKKFRAAQQEGRVLIEIPLGEISTTDLPRDRLDLETVATSDEMEELKASIRERGQKEPVEVYHGEGDQYQLKKGWRRYTALTQLFETTGDERFAKIVARVEAGENDRMDRYIDMVEENVVREDLTFAEMAQVALSAAADPDVEGADAEVLVNRLYGSLHKMKRSYIRSFVYLLSELGESLQWPKEVSRNTGIEVARAMKEVGGIDELREAIAVSGDAETQNKLLTEFSKQRSEKPVKKVLEPKEKFEFHVGGMKVTARRGECRIVSKDDFANISRDQLERAVKAFEGVLNESDKPRPISL